MRTFRFKIPIIGLIISSVLMPLLALNTAGPAFAAPCGVNCVDITGGTLAPQNEDLALDANSFTLDGTNKSTLIGNGTGPLMQVFDETGTGSGWNLQIKATQFQYVDGGSSTTYLKNSYIKVDPTQYGDSSLNIAACEGSDSCTLPSDGYDNVCSVGSSGHGVTAPTFHNIGTDADQTTGAATPYLLCNAVAATGMGRINLYPKLTFYLPGNVYSSIAADISSTSHTFSTTITLITTSGPA